MKKIKYSIFICLICACMIFISACTPSDVNDGTDGTTGESSNSTVESTEAPYWQLTCRTVKARKNLHFDVGANHDISLSFSEDWNVEKSADGASFDIIYASKTIGHLAKGSLASDEWSIVDDYSRKSNPMLSVKKFIEKKNGSNEYRYRFEYNCTVSEMPTVLSLCLDYVELDANAADRLYKSALLSAPTTVIDGMLGNIKDGNYLVLGNSFIGTSSIGTFLREMFALNNKSTNFEAISRGYAQVGTYTSDTAIMSSIENGNYDAVFICGFYANAEANNLAILEEACKKSDTELIIFPAHNEFETSITAARNKCPELKFLNWKGELDMLIKSGVDKWKLCYDDEHLHSTEYAGLIGAHMIYRAIYGEIPSIDGMTSINVSAAKELFGTYLETGCVELDYDVYKFN